VPHGETNRATRVDQSVTVTHTHNYLEHYTTGVIEEPWNSSLLGGKWSGKEGGNLCLLKAVWGSH